MSEMVSPLLQWLNANPEWAGLATFLISAGESVAIIGTIVPGSITMTAIGALAGAGVIPLWQTIFWAILGAVCGDGISYWMGYYFKDRIKRMWPFRDNPNVLIKGEMFVHKYGVMSVFIGRFVGPVRALVPLVAGMFGMRPWQFTIANVASAIGWAPAYMLPGILLGAASLELPPDIAIHVIMVFFIIFLFFLLCIWLTIKILQLIHRQVNQLQNYIWHRLEGSRYLGFVPKLLRHYDASKMHGQLALALLFLLSTSILIALIIYVKIKSPNLIVLNEAVFHFFRGLTLKTPALDTLMINFTILGDKHVILPTVFLVALWFVYIKRHRAASHVLGLGFLSAGSIYLLKHSIRAPRPWGLWQNPETFSMPSGHTTFAATILLGLAFFIGKNYRMRVKIFLYTIALLLAAAVSTSRLYLSAHWLTDVFSSWLLSFSLLTIIIISYQRNYEKSIQFLSSFLITLCAFLITFSFYHQHQFNYLKTAYTPLEYPRRFLIQPNWWKKDGGLPTYRVSLFGFPSQWINIQWSGNIDEIRTTLLAEGWTKPPTRDFISTIHRITNISSTKYLPMISPQYLDKTPALILTRLVQDNLLVLRLWDSHRILKETKETLWVGVVGRVPASYSWIYKRLPSDIAISSNLVFPMQRAVHYWAWKTMLIKIPLNKRTTRVHYQHVLMVKTKH